MKKLLISLLLMSAYTCVNAQYYDQDLEDFKLKARIGQLGQQDQGIQGSRYLEESFKDGIYVTADGKIFKGLKLRYDGFDDEIEISIKNENFRIASKEKMDYAVIGSDTLRAHPYQVGSKVEVANFFIITEGEVSVYAMKRIKYNKPEEPKAYQDGKPARFTKKNIEYYWTKGDDVAVLVSNKKELEKFIGKEAVSFMKKEKLSLRKADDLIEIVAYCTSNIADKAAY